MTKPLNIQQHKGAALLLFLVFFLFGSTALVMTFGRSVYVDQVAVRLLEESKQSLYISEAGVEEVTFRHIQGREADLTEVLTFAGGTVTSVTTEDLPNNEETIVGTAVYGSAQRSTLIVLYLGEGAIFGHGVQSGNGGFELVGNATIIGNVFSNATVTGTVNSEIRGDVISAGPYGYVNNIHATGSIWAQNIGNSDIGEDIEYYNEFAANVVGGIKSTTTITGYQPTSTLPITDAMISAIENDIINTGWVIASTSPACNGDTTMVINASTSTGNVFIDCNLEIRKTGPAVNVTLTGNVWVSGNITFTQGPNIIKGAGLGNDLDVVLIADNEDDRTNSSKVIIAQSTDFETNSTSSQIYLMSMNTAAENKLAGIAINMSNAATGDVRVYAPHGKIVLGNGVDLEQISGYQIRVENNATVEYKKGKSEDEFRGGGGGFTLLDWREVE